MYFKGCQSVSQFSHSVVSDSVTPGTAARQAFLSITNSQGLLKLMSAELVMPTISSSVIPSSCCFQLSQHHEVKSLSHVRLFAMPWTVAYQVPPSMGFSRQEYGSGLPFPSPGDIPNPGIEPRSPTLYADIYHLNHQEMLFTPQRGFPLSSYRQIRCDSDPIHSIRD